MAPWATLSVSANLTVRYARRAQAIVQEKPRIAKTAIGWAAAEAVSHSALETGATGG